MPSSLVGRQRHGYVALGVGAAKRDDGMDGLESRRRLTSSEELAAEGWVDLVGGGEWGKGMDTGCNQKISESTY